MKKLLLILLCFPFIGFGQKTYVPDDNFEFYLETIGMGDGISFNDSVLTGSINVLSNIDVSNQNISDLTGIEDFTALDFLVCNGNQLTNLDLSSNNFLRTLLCSNNQLTSLDLSQNLSLEGLDCGYNQLTSLDVSQNTSLTYLGCSSNQLINLDLSANYALDFLNCSWNQLTNLDLRNHPLNTFTNGGAGLITNGNYQLFCIDVDNPSLAQILAPTLFNLDAWTVFDTNCTIATGCLDSLACNYDSIATINDNSCIYLPVSVNNSYVTCSNFTDATLTVSYSTGMYTFLWSNGETTQSIDSLPLGSYNVIVTDSLGCNVTLNADVFLGIPPANNMSPEICYVTVDSISANNTIIIKEIGNLLASKFIIYKENSTNIFLPIDTIDHNSLEYIDVNSNTMMQSYRYKVSVLDTCGNESLMSDFHKTIHLTISSGVNGEVNLLWNNYEGYQPLEYLIFRSVNNGTMSQVGVLPGTNLAFTDLFPPSGILNYQVRALAPSCNIIPFANNSANMLVSNVINYSATDINEFINLKKVIKITDLLGRESKQTNQPLFYIYDDGTVEKKIVID